MPVRIVMLGDIVGGPGRRAVMQQIPVIHERWWPHLILANGENIPPTVAASVVGNKCNKPTQALKITNFDALIDQAEKRLHFNEKKMDDDPLGLLTVQSPRSKNKGTSTNDNVSV